MIESFLQKHEHLLAILVAACVQAMSAAAVCCFTFSFSVNITCHWLLAGLTYFLSMLYVVIVMMTQFLNIFQLKLVSDCLSQVCTGQHNYEWICSYCTNRNTLE